MVARADARGRVLIPRHLRIRYGIETGTPVEVRAHGDHLHLEVVVPHETSMARLCGALDEKHVPPDAPAVDATALKHLWGEHD